MATAVQLIVKYALWLYVFCALGALLYLRAALQARRERDRALFTLEREVASSRSVRSLIVAFVFVLGAGSVFAVERYVAPLVESSESEEVAMVTTSLFIPTPTSAAPTATVAPTPTKTLRPRPTRQLPPPASPTPTGTPVPPPPRCPNPGARIVSPGLNARLSGVVQILGSASVPNFQFYKLEWAPADNPKDVHVITTADNPDGLHYAPVTNGVLTTWNTEPVPPGAHILRLTIVDITGNYPPENICEVPVTVVR